MKTLDLTVDQQNILMNAFAQLEGYDAVVDGKTVRQQYKLGAQRRAIVKNVLALSTSLETWQKISNGIFKEHFPDVPEGEQVSQADRPEEFAKYRAAILEATKKTDQIQLIPLSAKVVYDDNEIPASSLVALEQHGLISED